jgi:Tol biopolymer transport system component/DNA-binding winged helix-turn-helix (wHTH) protein
VAQELLKFGPFTLDLPNRELRRDGKPIALQPKTFDLLAALVERRGRLVTKDELLSVVWSDAVVEESNLSQNIYLLRKVLGQDPAGQAYIETSPKRGYRFTAVATPVAADDAVVRTGTPKRPVTLLVAGVLALLAIAAAAAVFWMHTSGPPSPLDSMRLQRLTTNGRGGVAAISPDGKYVVHAERDGRRQSLILRQVATGGRAIAVPAAEADYDGVIFSHDGAFIYYLRTGGQDSAIYRMETLGGTPRQIVQRAAAVSALLGTPMDLSPDDRQIAFIRAEPSGGRRWIAVASVDGTDERRLLDVDPRGQIGSIAWSSDGRLLAYAEILPETSSRVTLGWIDLKSGSPHAIVTRERWNALRGLAWVPDNSALLAAARFDRDSSEQIWRVNVRSGELHRVTNDLNAYSGVSVTADGGSLVTVTMDFATEIWVSDAEDFAHGRTIVSGSSAKEGFRGIATAPDGHIVYEAEPNGEENIWMMNPDGGASHQLTRAAGLNIQPAVCPDGRIVFSSNRSGAFAVWRMNADGGGLTQLASFGGAPACAPDSQSVAFTAKDSEGRPSVWKVSIDGGAPVRVTNAAADRVSFSPDGRWIACIYRPPGRPPQIGLVPASGGEPRRVADGPADEPGVLGSTAPLLWSADGKWLTYAALQNGAWNLWRVGVAGGAPVQLTAFTDDRISVKFAWTPDGKRLICTRAAPVRDVVLIRGIR